MALVALAIFGMLYILIQLTRLSFKIELLAITYLIRFAQWAYHTERRRIAERKTRKAPAPEPLAQIEPVAITVAAGSLSIMVPEPQHHN